MISGAPSFNPGMQSTIRFAAGHLDSFYCSAFRSGCSTRMTYTLKDSGISAIPKRSSRSCSIFFVTGQVASADSTHEGESEVAGCTGLAGSVVGIKRR